MIQTIRSSCGNGINCPALHRKDGRLIASGPTITDPEILRELALPDHESAVEFSEQVLTAARGDLLDLDELASFIDEHHTKDLFRLETLSVYNVDSDGEDYQRYLRGEATANAEAKAPWLKRLVADTAAGRRWRRVHAVTLPLSDYLRYESEWCYTYNVAAGEDIRIIDDAGQSLPDVGDFFVLDGQHVIRSVYDQTGRFLGAEPITDPVTRAPYVAISELVWRAAAPFTSWWLRHPEFHRANRAA